jgi:tetratricopeptide (TPR) repeat protein
MRLSSYRRIIMKKSVLMILAALMLSGLASSSTEAFPRIEAIRNLKQARDLHRNSRSNKDLEKALEKSRKALEIFKRVNSDRGKGVALFQMGIINGKLGRYQDAKECFRQALETKRRLYDSRGQTQALNAMGQVFNRLGQYRKALEYFNKARETPNGASGKTDDEATLRGLAVTYGKLGRYGQALELAEKAVRINRKLGSKRGEALSLGVLGEIYKNLGRYQKALEAHEKALELSNKLGSRNAQAISLRNIASVYGLTGQHSHALRFYKEALAISKSTGVSLLVGGVCISMGQIYSQIGARDQALANYRKGLKIFTKLGLPAPLTKHLIADLYLDAGDPDKAESYVKESGSYACLGRLHLMKSEYKTAKSYYEQLLAFAKRTGKVNLLFTAYTGLGKACEGLEDYETAEDYYSKGMKLTEEIRAGLLPSERINFFQVKINGFYRLEPARGLTRVRMKQNRSAGSIQSSEVTRARVFAEAMARRADTGRTGVPKEIIEKEYEIVTEIASLNKERNSTSKEEDPERYAGLTKEIQKAEEKRKAFVEMLWKKYQPYASVKYPRPITLKEAAISPDEHIIMFDVLGEGVGVKLIKGKKIAQTSFVRWDLKDLEEDVRKFRRGFERFDLTDFDPGTGHKLYRKLLAAVLIDVPEGTPIIIIPDGVLAMLPFEALVTGGKATWKDAPWGQYPEGLIYFGDLYPVSYYQSITALTLARNSRKKKKADPRLLVVADPVFQAKDERAGSLDQAKMAGKDLEYRATVISAVEKASGGVFKFERLPQTGELAQHLKRLYGPESVVMTGLKANKSELLTNLAPKLDRYGSIVLATHGLVGDNIPGVAEPFLALTMVLPETDGFLKMTDVIGLHMNADVVALPACQTGLGRVVSGEGVMSMGRAFQYAGSKSVLMSLWSVAADSTVQLVESFFRHLREGKNKLEALRLARKEIRQVGFEHPFFWAPFILVGEVD